MKGKAEKQQQGQQIAVCVSARISAFRNFPHQCVHVCIFNIAFGGDGGTFMLGFCIHLRVSACLHSCRYESFHVLLCKKPFTHFPTPPYDCVAAELSAVVRSLKFPRRITIKLSNTCPSHVPFKVHAEKFKVSPKTLSYSQCTVKTFSSVLLMYSAQGASYRGRADRT